MAEPAAEEARGFRAPANAPRALASQLVTAVRFLTIVPLPGATAAVGQSALFFPLVGLAVGAVLAAVDALLGVVAPPGVRAVVLVGLLAVLTGGLHLDGLADSADGLAAHDRERALAIMRDGAIGAFGAVAVVLALALKLRSLDALPPGGRVLPLLLAPMLARWSMVALANGSLAARPDGLGAAMVRGVTFREFGTASVFAFAVTLAWAEARGLVLVLAVAALTIGVRILAHRRLGGVTGDVLGAVAELGEALALAVWTLAPAR